MEFFQAERIETCLIAYAAARLHRPAQYPIRQSKRSDGGNIDLLALPGGSAVVRITNGTGASQTIMALNVFVGAMVGLS